MDKDKHSAVCLDWKQALLDHRNTLEKITNDKVLEDNILKAADVISSCLENDGKLILFGNGGSASDAQHIAAEFVGRFLINRKSLPAVSLTANSSVLTAIANDFSFENVFSRQVEALTKKGDVVIGITTSGNSKNVLSALDKASQLGATTIILTGDSCEYKKADIVLSVPSSKTANIQEMHIMIGHFLAYCAEKKVCGLSGDD